MIGKSRTRVRAEVLIEGVVREDVLRRWHLAKILKDDRSQPWAGD